MTLYVDMGRLLRDGVFSFPRVQGLVGHFAVSHSVGRASEL